MPSPTPHLPGASLRRAGSVVVVAASATVGVVVASGAALLWGFRGGYLLALVVAAVILPWLWIGGRLLRAAAAGPGVDRRRAAFDAMQTGRVAVARIDAVAPTGIRVNRSPQVRLDLTVAARDRPPYRTTAWTVVPVTDVPARQPGARVVVVRPDASAPDVELVSHPDAYWSAETQRPFPVTGTVEEWPSRLTPVEALTGYTPARPRSWSAIMGLAVAVAAAGLTLAPVLPAVIALVAARPGGTPL